MKTLIFLIMTFFMFTTLGASTVSLTKDEYSLSYENVVTNDKLDGSPTVLLGVKPRSFMNFEFQVALSSGLLELENKVSEDNDLINKVVVWMNYSF